MLEKFGIGDDHIYPFLGAVVDFNRFISSATFCDSNSIFMHIGPALCIALFSLIFSVPDCSTALFRPVSCSNFPLNALTTRSYVRFHRPNLVAVSTLNYAPHCTNSTIVISHLSSCASKLLCGSHRNRRRRRRSSKWLRINL